MEEPNRFILTKNFKWNAYSRVKRAYEVIGKSMEIQFDSNTLLETIAGAKMKDIELKRGFVFKGSGFELESDTATYYLENDLLLGTDPVYVTGKDMRIHSSDGFRVEVDRGEFELFGSVNGVLESFDLGY